ncbi:unnamed protein product [Paramecium octaurelia]|uniref:Uncharacterized protein n=1 Tax=Paramecium octaurelia TaxID=43137 RepID=A0A8S1V8N6_PAROT|nr:unnamed protein product [Paramecium octaurelia]
MEMSLELLKTDLKHGKCVLFIIQILLLIKILTTQSQIFNESFIIFTHNDSRIHNFNLTLILSTIQVNKEELEIMFSKHIFMEWNVFVRAFFSNC